MYLCYSVQLMLKLRSFYFNFLNLHAVIFTFYRATHCVHRAVLLQCVQSFRDASFGKKLLQNRTLAPLEGVGGV